MLKTAPMTYTAAVAEFAQDAVYHIQQSDVDGLFTLVSGLVSVQVFSLLAQLLTLGVVLVVVFVVCLRRF